MACVKPFTGLLYNQKKIKDFGLVLAPPYDVITSTRQEDLYRKDPYNIIRLILGKEAPSDDEQNNKYTRAAHHFSTWQMENVLVSTKEPALYFYAQDYRLPNGEQRRRKGFIGLIKLEDFESKVVLPHEKTLSKPKADRLNLTVACRANFNPIFSLYADPRCIVETHFELLCETAPYLDITDEQGVRHQLWVVKNAALIQEVSNVLKDKQVVIADGHHRYETALNYRNLMRKNYPASTGDESFNFTMMYFSNMNDAGLVILPTHRMVKNIGFSLDRFLSKAGDSFAIEAILTTPETDRQVRKRIMEVLHNEATARYLFALYTRQEKQYTVLRLKDYALLDSLMDKRQSLALRRLDAHIMETVIFQGFLGISCSDSNREDYVAFAHADEEAVAMVNAGGFDVAFLVNSTRIEQVQEIVRQGEIMPQKSTYFYPKLLSGLAINKIDPAVIIK